MRDRTMPDRHPIPPTAAAPAALRRPVTTVVHGEALSDDFAWLKAENWREVLKDPAALPADIRAHLEAENAHAAALMAGTEALRETLAAEMRARIKEDDATVPAPDGAFAYYTRYREGGQHPLVCRRPREGGAEAVLLDGDALGAGKAFFELGGAAHSPDHRFLAWSADETGSEFHLMRVRDLSTGEDLPDRVPDTGGEAVWTSDGRAFYYVRLDENHRPSRVCRHRLGTPAEADELIYEEPDPGWFVDIDRTQSGAFCVISVGDHETSEAHLLDLADAAARPRLVAPREREVRYEVEHRGEDLIIRTNADGAEDFKLVTAPLAAPGRQAWRDLVPARPGIMVLSHVPFARHLVWLEREDARPRLVVRDLGSGEDHAVAFPEEAYSLSLESSFEFDTDVVRFTYASMTTPAETYDYDMATRERRLMKRQEVPSGHDPADYVTERLFATAPDGERVPISLVYRRGTPLDGTAPCLLYGYGAYGSAMPASFSTGRLSLVDRGLVYAIAHVRGGTEKGWRWYKDGKREKKPNTFTDFIACAEHLIAAGYTAKGRIVAHGGSAGGMLMGAVANMAPHLFAAIIADVPFVDVLNTMLDGDLPLTPPEWPEWGNPIEDPAAFAAIRAYSPYDRVAAQRYPAILALGGLSDPRVTYWEPAKWVAKLRATMTGGGPILLKTNMDAGHGGAAGRFDRIKEVAFNYAFALAVLDGTLGGD
ncbi:S9 family peptidase [Chelatococcus sp. SYSU_G07232]|uniref:S9 family peptidase n=1 Tax=Chelatococcus albus TaxID=3047466 RepID=A0ABT7AI50_9HYPH|nr:S9 family peptidase [Chelatococcus sp. SYSU_G07232]MDJ1159059.1 S9 family peptidase [Chelatococcus sp. SYSU_G07232]